MGALLSSVGWIYLLFPEARNKTPTGAETFSPPVKRCIRPDCPVLHGGLLGNEIIVEARLFTIRRGVVPVRYHSLYCYGVFLSTYFLCLDHPNILQIVTHATGQTILYTMLAHLILHESTTTRMKCLLFYTCMKRSLPMPTSVIISVSPWLLASKYIIYMSDDSRSYISECLQLALPSCTI